MLWNMGRLCRGTMGIMIIIAPEKIPADPRPAMALPKMKTGEVGAAPQMALPTSKITMDTRKTLQSHVSLCALFTRIVVVLEWWYRGATYHFML